MLAARLRGDMERPSRMSKRAGPQTPHLVDYAKMRAEFRWDDVRAQLAEHPDEDLNTAVAAVDRHVRQGRGAEIALR